MARLAWIHKFQFENIVLKNIRAKKTTFYIHNTRLNSVSFDVVWFKAFHVQNNMLGLHKYLRRRRRSRKKGILSRHFKINHFPRRYLQYFFIIERRKSNINFYFIVEIWKLKKKSHPSCQICGRGVKCTVLRIWLMLRW